MHSTPPPQQQQRRRGRGQQGQSRPASDQQLECPISPCAPQKSNRRRRSRSRSSSSRSQSTKRFSTFEEFCQTTSLHGWKFLTSSRRPLRFGWLAVVVASLGVATFFLTNSVIDFLSSTVQTTQDTSRGSLKNVFFPSVTLCNINQGRHSLFRQVGLDQNTTLLMAVLKQAYFGSQEDLSEESPESRSLLESVRSIFSSEMVVRKGKLTDVMGQDTTDRKAALAIAPTFGLDEWHQEANETYIRDAGWYFKTLAVQEIGENFVLRASYRRRVKDTSLSTSFLPFFGTDYGLCTLIKPQISFDPALSSVPFQVLMKNYTKTIKPGIQLGKENGLSILLDTEVYDYGFSPQRGEGFKVAIHHHMDQPIMALSDVDISPGFVTQLSVTPTLTVTTEEAMNRFTPEERMCYSDNELTFKYLPTSLYRYGLSNCLFAATYDQIMKQCHCLPYFHTMAWSDLPKICAGKSLLCMNKVLSNIGSHTYVEGITGFDKNRDGSGSKKLKKCYSSCHDQTNKMAVTTSVFPNLNTFTLGPEFCILFRKLLSTCNTFKKVTLEERYPGICRIIYDRESRVCNGKIQQALNFSMELRHDAALKRELLSIHEEFLSHNQQESVTEDPQLVNILYKYARENLALVNIYIKDPAVTQIKRDQKFPVIWFVANVGGILGLSMGCSLVTVFEIIHHAVLLFIYTGKRSLSKLHKSVSKADTLEDSTNRMSKSTMETRLNGAQNMLKKSNLNKNFKRQMREFPTEQSRWNESPQL